MDWELMLLNSKLLFTRLNVELDQLAVRWAMGQINLKLSRLYRSEAEHEKIEDLIRCYKKNV